jgi:hypothetical protein
MNTVPGAFHLFSCTSMLSIRNRSYVITGPFLNFFTVNFFLKLENGQFLLNRPQFPTPVILYLYHALMVSIDMRKILHFDLDPDQATGSVLGRIQDTADHGAV